MKSILMGWELGGGLGHLMRLRPLAVALLEAGHKVVLLAGRRSAKEVFAELADRHPGLKIGPAPVVKRKGDARSDPVTTHTLADVLAAQGFDDAKALFAAAERWHLMLDRIRPALVISDFSPTLNLVARGRVPLVVLGNGFTVPPDASPLPPVMPWEDKVPESSGCNEARVLRALARIAAANRLLPIERVSSLFQGDATFVCTLPEFDPHRRYRRAKVHFPYNVGIVPCGPPWHEREGNSVFLYLPGNHPHLEAVLDVLRARGVQGSAFVPKTPTSPPTASGAFGDLRLFERPPPLGKVLPRARLLIHHGGLGTATAGLMAGTPQLVLPRYLEHYVTAYGLHELRVAINFAATAPLDHDAFAKALGRLLHEPAPASRAMGLACRLTALNSETSLNLILGRCLAMVA